MISNRLFIISLLLLTTSCESDEETKKSLEVSKDIYETYKNIDQSFEESDKRKDSLLQKAEKFDVEFEKITPITDAKKKVGEENVKVEVLEYEE